MKTRIFCLSLFIHLAASGQNSLKTENVFIITTDGFRWQEVFTGADSSLITDGRFVEDVDLIKQMFWDSSAELRRKKLMPFFWNTIATQGQLFGNRFCQNKVNVRNLFKISYPGYNEMLTGYPDPVFIPNIPLRNRNTNILEWLDANPSYSGKVAIFSSWNIFPEILNRKRNHLPINSGYRSTALDRLTDDSLLQDVQENVDQKKNTRYDLLTFLTAKEYIQKQLPRVVMINFGETDQYAHEAKYDKYLQQANNVDHMIAELWYLVQTNAFYKNKTSFIICTDHGRGRKADRWFSHGILTGGSGESWLAILSPDIAPLGEIKNEQQIYENQMASTIAEVLGLEFETSSNTGKPISMRSISEYNLASSTHAKAYSK
ncbi:MAG: alkaline phosphatase family protein [Chitinophagales bacterium]